MTQDFQVPHWTTDSTLTVAVNETAPMKKRNPFLKDISFQVKGFQKVGIIGASGAGKSTLIDLLSGFSTVSSGSITSERNSNGRLFATWMARTAYLYSATSLYFLWYGC